MINPRTDVVDQSVEDGWVLVGKVLAPIGVQGEVKIEVHSGVSHRYSPGAVLYLDGSPFHVLSCRARVPSRKKLKYREAALRQAQGERNGRFPVRGEPVEPRSLEGQSPESFNELINQDVTANFIVVRFNGVDSRAAAETIRGKTICVPESDVPSLPEDTYYHYEVLGMRVFTLDGEDLGSVTEILVTGANDVFVVSGDRGETLVPVLAGVVAGVDVQNNRLTVDLPETL